MHATRVLEIWLRRNCPFMHDARLAAVVKIVDGVVFGGKATLAELGRGIRNRVLEKHNVKCEIGLSATRISGASVSASIKRWRTGCWVRWNGLGSSWTGPMSRSAAGI